MSVPTVRRLDEWGELVEISQTAMSQQQVQINAELARCALASDVLAIVQRSVPEFNVVNCGTALSRIARAPDGRRLVSRGDDPNVALLLTTAAGLIRHHARHVESRQLASLLHGLGKLGVSQQISANLVSAVALATGIHAGKFNPQELANSLWGCAKLGVRVDKQIVDLLSDSINASLNKGGRGGKDWRVDWTAQGVSNVAWAFATLGVRCSDTKRTQVLVTLFGVIQSRAREFNAQEVANMLWATAKLAVESENETEETDTNTNTDTEATLSARRASSALAGRATTDWFRTQKTSGKLESQHIANIAWACGKLGLGGDTIGNDISRAAADASTSMNTQELSMTAWAVAAFDSRDNSDVLLTIASAFTKKAHEATPQQLATCARAFAKLGYQNDSLMDAVADSVLALPTPTETQLLPQDVANLLWAFAKLQLGSTKLHKKVFHLLAKAARKHLRSKRKVGVDDDSSEKSSHKNQVYTPQQLTMLIWAHGMLGHEDGQFLNACVSAVRENLNQCNARDLTNVTWGFASLGVNASNKPKLIARIGRAARRQFKSFNSQELLKFLGAFERLGGVDTKLAELVGERKTVTYDFPALSNFGGSKSNEDTPNSSVTLLSATPTSFKNTEKESKRVDDSCGGLGRGNTGVALWEGSFVLAEWLSRQSDPAVSEDIQNTGTDSTWGSGGWSGMVGVELGAGLGLPTIVASKLGVAMIATDGALRFLSRLSFLGSESTRSVFRLLK